MLIISWIKEEAPIKGILMTLEHKKWTSGDQIMHRTDSIRIAKVTEASQAL